jgi:uncharacterized Ntn-hydrolase superfamily protein
MLGRKCRLGRVVGVGLSLLLSSPAWATWSIVGVDPETREVGVAGATCGPMVWFIGGLAPGEGAMVSQYATWGRGRRLAVEALEQGRGVEAVLDLLRKEDRKDEIRQYGIVRLDGGAAQFTGKEVEATDYALAGDTWAVQGNTLASRAVVEAAAAVMRAGQGTLGDRLLTALEAGADEGGDKRCDPGDAARSAFLYVAQPGDKANEPSLEYRASGKGAVEELANEYANGEAACASVRGAEHMPIWPVALVIGLFGMRFRRNSEVA